ncbi:thymidine phosphorylase [Porcipelethomonas sp.]|uniref:thymidine phosphorylase n=1 Tax=Porcipelethomonas sp. TaxID=2981675 RepID=UPI003EF1AA21
MNVCDIIFKTKRHEKLKEEEIKWLIDGYVEGSIPDYQISAWLMAVCFSSLTEEETVILTKVMRDSGDVLDLGGINGVTVDKHSTGGIGDKTSLIIAPVCAACGIYVPKMSGRGLGFTGGTIDKLESIPGFQVNIDFDRYIDIINKNGAAIIAQSGQLVPADKKLYALRDVTATVDSIPLICSSIMSKKLATGADCILLDVKTGSGAFMKNTDDARKLAELMVKTGESAGKKCRAMITDMNEPLGNAVGNSLEVIEACEILSGKEKGRLYELCMELAANMLELGGKGNIEECRKLAVNAIDSGCAMERFQKMIEAQEGDPEVTENYSLFDKPLYKYEIKADKSGYISDINSEAVGMAALMTGAGRQNKGGKIDSSAGIILNSHRGDYIHNGDVIMTLYSSSVSDFSEAAEKASDSVEISGNMPEVQPAVMEII